MTSPVDDEDELAAPVTASDVQQRSNTTRTCTRAISFVRVHYAQIDAQHTGCTEANTEPKHYNILCVAEQYYTIN